MNDATGDLRASDGDRDRLVEFLREHFAQGRLDEDEFQERMEQVYRAKTMAELAPLTRDLPARDLEHLPVPTQARRAVARRSAFGHPAMAIPWGIWGGASALNLVIWFLVSMSSGPGWAYPWWIWVAAPAGVVLLTVTLVLEVLGVFDPERKASGR